MPNSTLDRRRFLLTLGAAPALGGGSPVEATPLDALKAGWLDPPRSVKPHTRWWWPGSAVTRSGIDWQLEQMAAQGIGGVEICCVWEMYEKGNIAYLSDEWLAMVRHVIGKAAALDLEVALTFGPGWDLGGAWVPPEQRSKCLARAFVEADGPADFSGPAPVFEVTSKTPRSPWVGNEPLAWSAPDQDAIVAVVAARVDAGRLDPESFTVLAPPDAGGVLRWRVPAGRWRIFAFRLRYTGQQNSAQNQLPENWVIDHFNKDAVLAYSNHLNSAFARGFGAELGRTVDSYFADSWEVVPIHDTILWSNSLLDDFRADKGYDLTPYLPALWHDAGPVTPRVRYDVNEFLHRAALERTFAPLVETMARYGVQARIQPHYRFAEEVIQGAGVTPRPETEVTTARFATVPDPRKATVSGARLYGGNRFVSAEAYTFLDQHRYRTTLAGMKRATDAFFRDGVTQFYNHGYVYTPEMGPAPSRDIPWANRISHISPWWPWYKHLAAYIGRAGFLLRQGELVADALFYSPQATAWTGKAVWWIERRVMNYGDIPQLLVAHGYDYDLANDDLLQTRARAAGGRLRIGDAAWRFLILPAVRAVPPETLRVILEFARAGGIVLALESLPEASAGLADWEARDAEVRRLVGELKATPGFHFLEECRLGKNPFSSNDQTWRPMPPPDEPRRRLLEILRRDTPPDFSLDGGVQSNGLCHHHRRVADLDVYFVTNLQPNPAAHRAAFRVAGKTPEIWDAMTGEIRPAGEFAARGPAIEIDLRLAPWASLFVIFRPGKPVVIPARRAAEGEPPPPLPIGGPWTLVLESPRFRRVERRLDRLVSWTEDPATRAFSGIGVYRTEFELPAGFLQAERRVALELGQVGDVADVILNGRFAGAAWMEPYRVDVAGFLLAGLNRLEIRVANTLANEVAGMDAPPPVPPELIPHYGGEGNRYPAGRQRFAEEKKAAPPPSGLLGPVRLAGG